MRAGKNTITGEVEIYLDTKEAESMKEMIRGAKLPQRQMFHQLLDKI